MALNLSTNKKIGLISATGLGVSSIMGSGWLFALYKSAALAGPASIISWVLAGLIICLLGLCFAEIATLYPRRGLSAIIPLLSHNKYFAFPFAIANWLGIVAVIPLESDATIQYLMNLVPNIIPYLYQNNELTFIGQGLSLSLILIFTIINYWGASFLVKTNNILALIKVTIPIFIAIVMITTAFHPHNFSNFDQSTATFMPYGPQAIFTAMLTTGIIVAFNGFQTVISFSSEIKNPNKIIPLSVVIAVLFCLCIYIALQVAFIGGVPAELLKSGWNQLQFSAPVVQILGLMGLSMLSTVVYFGATVSPSGTAIAYTGAASRMFTAMARNEQMPKYFDVIHPVYNLSRRSLVLNTILASVFLLMFRSWGNLAQVLSILHVLSYLPVPIALWVFRSNISKEKYPFRLPFGKTISLLIFGFFTYLFTLADLKIASEVMLFFAFFMGVFIVLNCRSIAQFVTIFSQMWSMVFYFACLIALILISPNHCSLLTDTQFLVVVAITSIVAFITLTNSKKSDFNFDEAAAALNPLPGK